MSSKYLTDEDILEALKKAGPKQDAALEYIYQNQEYRQGTKMVVRSFSKMRLDDWEGIFHESLIQLVKCVWMGKFREETNIKNYFLGIVRNKCREAIRRENKLPPTMELPPEDLDAVRNPLDLILEDEMKNILRSAVLDLGESCIKILEYWALCYSMKEIAKEMELSNERVAITYKSRCKKKLIQKLEENPEMLTLLREYQWI